MLYIGAIIEDSAFHTRMKTATADGGATRAWGPTVAPARLADLLWTVHRDKDRREATYPARRFERRPGRPATRATPSGHAGNTDRAAGNAGRAVRPRRPRRPATPSGRAG